MQRLVMMFGVLLAVGIGCLIWPDREAATPILPGGPLSDVGQTPAVVVLEGRARTDGAVHPAAADGAAHGVPGAAASEVDAAKAIKATTLLVRVTLAGKPAPAGVFVRLRGEDDPTPWTGPLKTDKRGIARFEGLLHEDYTIQVRHYGYQMKTGWWTNEEEGAEARAEIDLAPGLPFDGRVIDALTEAPIEGASVIYSDWDETYEVGPTDGSGAFHVPGMKDASEGEILARAPGYVAKQIDLIADSGRIHPAVPVLRLERGGTLVGAVLSPEGEPVAGARVRISPQNDAPKAPRPLTEQVRRWQHGDWGVDENDDETVLSAVTGPDGSFRAEGLNFKTTYDVFARAKGYGASDVTSGVRVTAVRSEGSMRLRLCRPGRVLLTVVLPEEGRLSATQIRLIGKWDTHKPEKSKWKWQHLREPGWRSRKSYRFESVNPGPAHVYVEAEGYRSTRVRLHVAEGATVEVEVHLERGGIIAGIVVDPEGKPVWAATVRARPVSQNNRRRGNGRYLADHRSGRTDRRGRFELCGLPPGQLSVVASASAGGGAMATVEDVHCVAPARGLRLQLVRSGGVRVRLLKPSGEPFTGRVMIWIMQNGGGSGRETKPEDGVVSSSRLADGEYELSLQPHGYAWSLRKFQIRDGKTLDLGDIVLDEGVTVSGQVVDDLGSPIPGATIDTLSSGERRTVTDSDGLFSLDHFPNGEFSLAVEAERHGWAEVEVQPATTTGLRVVLRRCAHVLARVRSPEGDARGKLTIQFRRPGAKALTIEGEGPDGKTRTVEYYEDSEWGWVDGSGLLDEWIVAGTYIGYWKDEAERWHQLGTWTFAATKEYDLSIVLPAQ